MLKGEFLTLIAAEFLHRVKVADPSGMSHFLMIEIKEIEQLLMRMDVDNRIVVQIVGMPWRSRQINGDDSFRAKTQCEVDREVVKIAPVHIFNAFDHLDRENRIGSR